MGFMLSFAKQKTITLTKPCGLLPARHRGLKAHGRRHFNLPVELSAGGSQEGACPLLPHQAEGLVSAVLTKARFALLAGFTTL